MKLRIRRRGTPEAALKKYRSDPKAKYSTASQFTFADKIKANYRRFSDKTKPGIEGAPKGTDVPSPHEEPPKWDDLIKGLKKWMEDK